MPRRRRCFQGGGEVECLADGESGAIVGQLLHGMRRPQGVETALDAGQHQITHHLAADAAGAGVPGDDLAVTGVDVEDKAHHLAVPAADLLHIERPAQVGGGQGDDAALMCTNGTMADVLLQQQLGAGHEAEGALVVDRRIAGCRAHAVEQGGDPPMVTSRPRIGELADRGGQFIAALAAVAATRLGGAQPLNEAGAADGDCRAGFFSCVTASASSSTSTSSVLRPSRRSRSRKRLAAVTSSSALTAARPPWTSAAST